MNEYEVNVTARQGFASKTFTFYEIGDSAEEIRLKIVAMIEDKFGFEIYEGMTYSIKISKL